MTATLTVLYVVALAGGTGCGAFLRIARLRHEDPSHGDPCQGDLR